MGTDDRSLFDGRALSGWRPMPRLPTPVRPGAPSPATDTPDYRRALAHTGRWTVEDGAICGRQDPSGCGLVAYLVSDGTFGDVELCFEARPDWPADTGIMLRATPAGSTGYQVLLDHRKSGNIGGFYGNGIGRFHAIAFNVEAMLDKAGSPTGLRLEDPATTIEPITDDKRARLTRAASGEAFLSAWCWADWNAFRICVVGALPRITVRINDVMISEIDMATLRHPDFDGGEVLRLLGPRGHIALEVHDNDLRMGEGRWGPHAACRWRDIRVTALDGYED